VTTTIATSRARFRARPIGASTNTIENSVTDRLDRERDGNVIAETATRGGGVGVGRMTLRCTTTQSSMTNVARNTTSWRHRLKTIRTTTVPIRSAKTTPYWVRAFRAFATSVRNEDRRSVMVRVSGPSARPSASHRGIATTRIRPTAKTTRASHNQRVQPGSRGRGGGSPDGRRRRAPARCGGVSV
jgi:hypothetical protein